MGGWGGVGKWGMERQGDKETWRQKDKENNSSFPPTPHLKNSPHTTLPPLSVTLSSSHLATAESPAHLQHRELLLNNFASLE